MEDSYRHKGLRRQLVSELRHRGIQDERVLRAIESLPRHFFLDSALDQQAYQNKALPILRGQTISQPYTVAAQTELLEVQPKEKVLEIGTGSGYQAAVLALLGARVYTVERHKPLYRLAKQRLQELGIDNVRCFWRDGGQGLPNFAPFDKIIVTAALPELIPNLQNQLTIGGRMVAPVQIKGKDRQDMLVIKRIDENTFENRKAGQYRFVPFLPGRET